ncbi:hypothetical protein AQS70_21735 [Pseudomonas endophytica]|uniref:Thymidylate kinase n=1 Tax=Pseudomonas endophytica TaxID=1563157 RepID=A0A0Q1CIB6_9PSED|nr:hypothetical protein [Pseudomonas endophytica]KQB54486.1 hypothetical protein AQS70_21735 [Pseudomonas endophytica]
MLIAFAGLPSSGKSSTAKALGRLIHAEVHLEPEESAWPELVKERATVGAFTALTWFRTVRVPQLFKADDYRKRGGISVIDSYYDVLVDCYLGDVAFEWLISKRDPYFAAAQSMARTDWLTLPKADILVFLRLDEKVWREFMSRRDRDFDRTAELCKYFEMQAIMEEACRKAAKEHGTRLINVDQESATPEITARRVADVMGMVL